MKIELNYWIFINLLSMFFAVKNIGSYIRSFIIDLFFIKCLVFIVCLNLFPTPHKSEKVSILSKFLQKASSKQLQIFLLESTDCQSMSV